MGRQVPEGRTGHLGLYEEEQAVSCDISSDTHSFMFDAEADIALNINFVKFISWNDNEFSYNCRVVELMVHMASKE